MRTTIELSDGIYRSLRSVAAERGVRGFSPIVEEALSIYLEGERERAEITAAIESARGAWAEEDVRELERELKSAWTSGWQIDRSSTPTS